MRLLFTSLILLAMGVGGLGAERPPNVILIFVDDLGYGDLGCFGAEGYATPHLDRMADEGMLCTQFYVAAAVCSASRAALLTGRYPVRTGVTGVISANTSRALPLEEVTLAERFRALGYRTGIFGKWHLGNTPDVWPLKQGFEVWFGTIGSNDMGKGKPSLEQRRAGKAGVEVVENETVVEIDPDQRLLTQRYTDRAITFMERHRDEPFFLYLPHNMPHTPLFASEAFEGSTDRGLFGDVIAELDASVGRILDAVERLDLDSETLVLFTSDNGPWLIFGDHGGSAGPLAGGKKQTLEGGMRVPMIARWPGHIPARHRSDQFQSTLDLTPTLMALCGGRIEEEVDGIDVSADWLGAEEPLPDRPFGYFWERELQALRYGVWKLRLPHTDRQAPGVIRDDGERGEVVSVERVEALFNLVADPAESTDRSQDKPGVARRLRAMARQLQTQLTP